MELTPRSNSTPAIGSGDDGAELVEVGPPEVDPVAEGRQRLRGQGQGLVVAVEADQGVLREGVEQGGGVPAGADGGVDDDAGRHGSQDVDHLCHHDGQVAGRGRRSAPPIRHPPIDGPPGDIPDTWAKRGVFTDRRVAHGRHGATRRP